MGWLTLSPAWAQQAAPTGSSDFHRLLLCMDGTVKGWGSNNQGQLGTASAGSTITTPTVIPLANPAVVVRTATNHGCSYAVGADGSIWSWGTNNYGQLGVGSGTASTTTPVQVPGITNAVAVAGGYAHAAALCADGTVWTWGNGIHGELGTGSIGIAYTPQHIPSTVLHDIRQVVCGSTFCLALDASGQVWVWGQDIDGSLGTGAAPGFTQATPVQVPGLSNVRFIDADDWRCAAVTADVPSKVYDWGRNTSGELGLGHSNPVTTPALVGQFGGAVSVTLAEGSAIVVKNDGSTLFWGFNNVGQRGNSSPTPTFCPTPVAGPTFSRDVQLFGSSGQYLSIENTGTVKTWGFGGNCPLGYTPAITGANGGSCVPTTPTDACTSVPNAGFPPCGLPQQRAFYQRPGASYEAARHGYTVSPAELGTYGQLTTIDLSQAPYNGTLAFSGVYHVRGNVKFINGTVTTTNGTLFYIDGPSGQSYPAATTVEVTNADLRLSNSVLQAQCPATMWGGIVLGTSGKIHTFNGNKPERRCLIRDAGIAVYSATASSQYYLTYTDFLNNSIGLYDYNYYKNAAQPGEGAQYCTFVGNTTRNTDEGIYFEPVDGDGTYFAGNYAAASFNNNTFSNCKYGVHGFATNASFLNNTFTNNWGAAIYTDYNFLNGNISVKGNTITLPATVPAGQSATTTYGLNTYAGWKLENNTIRCLSTVANTPSLLQVGVRILTALPVCTGNTFLNLDRALDIAVYPSSTLAYNVTANTFTNTKEGVVFRPDPAVNPTTPSVTLRCNSFASTVTGAVGVWVQSGTPFPSTLGSASQPNGNNFSGIADGAKRFVNDANASLVYHRYNSQQEALGNSTGNNIYKSDGTTQYGTVNQTTASGTGACGNSSATPGVYARPAAGGGQISPAASSSDFTPELRAGYPNPASETVTFAYRLLDSAATGRVLLRDLLGQTVATVPAKSEIGTVQLSVTHLLVGFYTAVLEVEGRVVATQKLTVQH
jgi:alpha-tubulin suppressor-like RCC1 family protein